MKLFISIIGALITGFCLILSPVSAMSSANYLINWDNINVGGVDSGVSENYKLRDTIGDTATGPASSETFYIRAGYRQVDEDAPFITFNVIAQYNDSQTVYSAFNNAGFTVTVADASGYATDDYIEVVENQGGAQLVAIGKITAIDYGTGVITVDKWSGDHAVIGAPADDDDFVYKFFGNIADLGIIWPGIDLKTSVSMTEITTDAEFGYGIAVGEDGNFRAPHGPDVDDVLDGTVSAGSEEYGISVTGDYSTVAGDIAITVDETEIAQSPGVAVNDRLAIVYQAAVLSTTGAGEFSHTVSYYAYTAY